MNELEGVDRVELYGKRSECINISLLQDRMANLGVKPAEVLATLNGQNKTTYTGYYENGENRIRVTVNDKFKTVEDIGKMLIQGHDDDQLRLSDIARIEKAYENPTRNEMFYDHERALGILIAASSGSDIIKVGHAVESKLEELKAERLPAGVECHKIFYQRTGRQLFGNLCHQPDRIRHHRSTDTDDSNGVQERPYHRYQPGHHRIRFFSVPLFGRRNHAARIIGCFCTGNGHVGRQRHRHHRRHTGRLEGRQKPDGSHDRHRKTDSHASSGRDTDSIIAFLPIYMSPDTAGVYTRDLFIVLAVSLLLSWILALIHVPLMADRRLHPAIDTDSTGKRVYKGKIYATLRSALRFGLAHRWSFVFAMTGLLLLSVFGYQYMRQGFFPDMVYDQLYMEYKLPEGNNYTRVVRDLEEIETYLKGREEITHVTTSIGGTPGRYNLVRSIANPSLSYGD